MNPLWVLEPDQAYRVTSKYGWRTDPVHGGQKMHSGVDLATDAGARILAMEDGVVDAAGWSDSEGNFVRVLHDGGIKSSYLHMLYTPEVLKGDPIGKGQLLGYVGSTGKSTGNHLHFAIHDGNSYIDPIAFLNGRHESVQQIVQKKKKEEIIRVAGTTSSAVAGVFVVGFLLILLAGEKS